MKQMKTYTKSDFHSLEQLKKQITSMYNGWVHTAPETVAECIANVAAILPERDACDAAFCEWWSTYNEHPIPLFEGRIAWDAAWKAAKESKA